MGANSSVFLHPELPADDETVNAFQEFENECISRNLKATEIYDLLNEKYDHLLGREMEKRLLEMQEEILTPSTSTASLPPIVETAEVATQTVRTQRKSKKSVFSGSSSRSKMSESNLSRATTAAVRERTALPQIKSASPMKQLAAPKEDIKNRKPSLPKQQKVVGRTFGSLSRPRLPSLQSKSCDVDDASVHDNIFPSDIMEGCHERSSSSDSVTVADCYNGLQSLSLDDLDRFTEDGEDPDLRCASCEVHPDGSPLCAIPPEESTLNADHQRRGSVVEDLLTNMSHFECRLCKKKFGSSELLETHIAFSQTHKETVQRVRAKYARAFRDADKVGTLLRKATERFQKVLQTKKHFVDGKISAEKMRWQRAIGKVISQFTAKQIEKIMQELQEEEDYEKAAVAAADEQTAPQAGVLMFTSSRFFWRTKSRFNVYVMYHKHCHALEVISVLMPDRSAAHEEPKVAPRLFLSMQALEAQHDLWQAAAPEQTAVITAEDTGITRAMRIVRDVVQSLKIDYEAVNQGVKAAENALFYDDNMAVMRQLASPVLPLQPKTLILTPTEQFCRMDADDAMVQAKLNELSQAQRLLAQAVDNAEQLAMRIAFRDSPRRRPILLSPLALVKSAFSPKPFPKPGKFTFDQI